MQVMYHLMWCCALNDVSVQCVTAGRGLCLADCQSAGCPQHCTVSQQAVHSTALSVSRLSTVLHCQSAGCPQHRTVSQQAVHSTALSISRLSTAPHCQSAGCPQHRTVSPQHISALHDLQNVKCHLHAVLCVSGWWPHWEDQQWVSGGKATFWSGKTAQGHSKGLCIYT
jgi:hypothetical protein